jgi:MGT family glycosyltransferase
MARLGVFCPPWTGHLNPLAALGRELARRGHEVVFCNVPDAAEPIRRLGFEPLLFGERGCPEGTLSQRNLAMAELEGLAAIRAGLSTLGTLADALFEEGRPSIEAAGFDLWLVDHLDYAASTLAAMAGAPFVSIVVGLMRHSEEGVPGFSGELPSLDPAAIERDRRFNESMLAVSRPFREGLGRRRREAGLGPFCYDTLWSPLAQITQQPEEFEFSRRRLPARFHFTGPFVELAAGGRARRRRDRDRPLVYASFGTAQNRVGRLRKAAAEAAADLDAQVVLSLGGDEPGDLEELEHENLSVVRYVPQLEILAEADAMVTHAGMNSTLECLANGVPMVAVPIAHDQHGIAARLEWTGTGVCVPAAECDAGRLRAAIERVLADSRFSAAARRFQRIVAERNGLGAAADIVERVLATGRPVLRTLGR